MEMPTRFGVFSLHVWAGERGRELVALATPMLDPSREVMVRIHSECLTGDTFHSLTCDCGPQKDSALRKIEEHGNGIFIYHRQEGRNTGLFKKIQSYNLMQQGMDTHEALIQVAGHPDPREYSDALTAMKYLLGERTCSIRLLTNNPYKALFLERHGYAVVIEPLRTDISIHSAAYVQAKAEKFLHNSVGSAPYTSVTLARADLKDVPRIMNGFSHIKPLQSGRHLFVGVSLYPDEKDLKNQNLIERLQALHRAVSIIQNFHFVLHMYYPLTRKQQRSLMSFLSKLNFDYSLQFRLPNKMEHGTRVDVDLLDSFHAIHVIFQLKSEHFYLLEQRSFADYFSSPNKYILLDESFGSGTKATLADTHESVLKLISRGLSRISVAGGYDGSNVLEIHALEDYFKIPISVDAESKLRTEGQLDPVKVQNYLSFFFQPQKYENS